MVHSGVHRDYYLNYEYIYSLRGYVDTWIRGIRIYPHSDRPWRARVGGPQGTSGPGEECGTLSHTGRHRVESHDWPGLALGSMLPRG